MRTHVLNTTENTIRVWFEMQIDGVVELKVLFFRM